MPAVEITCEGKEFRSIKDFVNYYGLHYPKAQRYLQQGKTPEEVLVACGLTSRSKTETEKKEGKKRYFCEYNGVKYKSLYEAACALGLQPSQLYEYRSRNHLSPSAALEQMMEKKGRVKRKSPVSKKCVVDGVEYESQEAAILAYHIPRITIYSRMQREGITFEEALSKGRKVSLYRKPMEMVFPSLHFTAAQDNSQQPAMLHDLETALHYYNYSVETVHDPKQGTPALLIDGHTYIYLNLEAKSMEVASEIPFSVSLEKINSLNRKYAATKLFLDTSSRKLYLSMFQVVKEQAQDIKTLLNTYLTYATIRETLVRSLALEADKKSGSGTE